MEHRLIMPYITQEARNNCIKLDKGTLVAQASVFPTNEGELNYAVTVLVSTYIKLQGGLSYANVNAVVGALECAKLEFFRRVAAPYEDLKIKENGDVYPSDLLTKE